MNKLLQNIEKENWPKTRNQKINIFLTEEEKKLLTTIKKNFSISISTIVDLIAFHYYMADYTRQLMSIDTNMYKTTGPKTSIKVQNQYKLTAKQINNAVLIYCHKLDKDPNNNKFHEKIRNQLNHAFQDAYDPWVHYYEFCHMKQRYERENQK